MKKRTVSRWHGIRTLVIPRPSIKQTIERLADTISREKTLSSDDCRSVASYLRQIARSSKALEALEPKTVGHPHNSYAPEMAIDYVIQKELLGKALAAKNDVAKFWKVSEATVKDAFTDYGKQAEALLNKILESRVGMKGLSIAKIGVTPDTRLTRKNVLMDCAQDLRSWAKRDRSSRSSRKKSA